MTPQHPASEALAAASKAAHEKWMYEELNAGHSGASLGDMWDAAFKAGVSLGERAATERAALIVSRKPYATINTVSETVHWDAEALRMLARDIRAQGSEGVSDDEKV